MDLNILGNSAAMRKAIKELNEMDRDFKKSKFFNGPPPKTNGKGGYTGDTNRKKPNRKKAQRRARRRNR